MFKGEVLYANQKCLCGPKFPQSPAADWFNLKHKARATNTLKFPLELRTIMMPAVGNGLQLDDNDTQSDAPTTNEGTTSPIPPRFTKDTQRGVKRHLDHARYRAEANRKKLVWISWTPRIYD